MPLSRKRKKKIGSKEKNRRRLARTVEQFRDPGVEGRIVARCRHGRTPNEMLNGGRRRYED